VTSGDITSLSIAIIFDSAISPRPGVPTNSLSGNPAYGPFASITGYQTITGGLQGDFGMRYELLGTSLQSLNGGIANPTFIDNRGGFPFPTLSPADSLIKWTSMNSNGSVPMPYGSSLGVHDFNDGITTDDYVGGILLTVTPVGGASFEVGAQFNYSVDGVTPPGSPVIVTAVPEPSSLIFLLSVATGLLGYRRRS